MTRPLQRPRARTGMTLVELLVVMAIITALIGLVALIAPGAMNSDRTLAGTAQVQSTLKVSQAMAAAARHPRGVRLIAPPGGLQVTEMQLIEMRPVLVPNKTPHASNNPRLESHVEFRYLLSSGASGQPPRGTIISRECIIHNLTIDDAYTVWEGGILVFPTLGYWWTKFRPTTGLASPEPETAGYDTSKYKVTLTWQIEVFPDAALGAAGVIPVTGNVAVPIYVTHHFGVYSPPVPIVGEPTIPMPNDVVIDLQVSLPTGQPGMNYDILFAPSGQLIDNANGHIFLWVRDASKVPNMAPANPTAAPYQWQFNPTLFRQGGEQWIVGIRGRSGTVGTAPVQWPDDMTGGTYIQQPGQPVQDPFSFARKQLQ